MQNLKSLLAVTAVCGMAALPQTSSAEAVLPDTRADDHTYYGGDYYLYDDYYTGPGRYYDHDDDYYPGAYPYYPGPVPFIGFGLGFGHGHGHWDGDD